LLGDLLRAWLIDVLAVRCAVYREISLPSSGPEKSLDRLLGRPWIYGFGVFVRPGMWVATALPWVLPLMLSPAMLLDPASLSTNVIAYTTSGPHLTPQPVVEYW
jgi:hypothetical protein